MHDKIREVFKAGIVVGAICLAPRILAHAGVLRGRKATGWDGDHRLTELYRTHKVRAQLDHGVVIDGQLVTGQGPAVAQAFAQAVAQAANSVSP